MAKKLNQADRIINYINEFGSITGYEAMRDLGVMCFHSRMTELKKAGYQFASVIEQSKNRYGEAIRYYRYKLDKDKRDVNNGK